MKPSNLTAMLIKCQKSFYEIESETKITYFGEKSFFPCWPYWLWWPVWLWPDRQLARLDLKCKKHRRLLAAWVRATSGWHTRWWILLRWIRHLIIKVELNPVHKRQFFSRPSPKAGRELHIDRMMEGWWGRRRRTLSEPEPVTGPWVYTEAVYLF